MARLRTETDLKTLAKKRYDALLAERNMIDSEVKAIEGYLKSLGEFRGQKKGRTKKAEVPGSGAASNAMVQAKTEAPSRKIKPSKPSKPRSKVSATKAILSAIEKTEQGISIDEIMKSTKLGRQTVNGVLNRMKKEGKVKAAKRGIYVKA